MSMWMIESHIKELKEEIKNNTKLSEYEKFNLKVKIVALEINLKSASQNDFCSDL